MTRHATMTNRNDIQNSMHVLAMTWSSTTPPLGVSDTHTCSPSSWDPHNAYTMSSLLDTCPSRRRWVPTAKCDPRPSGVRQALMPLLLLTQSFVD